MNNAKFMVISRSGLETISVDFKLLSMAYCRYSPKRISGSISQHWRV
jgi:hypothetical protein